MRVGRVHTTLRKRLARGFADRVRRLRAVPQAHDEAFEQQRACARRIEAAALGVEQLHRVELSDGGAVRALHVVGEDFELGLAVRRRAAVEQHGLDRLLGVGLLSAARDLDLAEV